jgi:glycosyltransferase involved in cell wall biosynthesis
MIHLPLCLNPSFSNSEKKFFKETEIKSFQLMNEIIVTSEFSKSEIIKMGIDEEKIHVISPGINVVASEREYPENPKNLLCVSRILKSKGQLDLIKALKNLQQFDWKLTLCGGYDVQDDYYKEIVHQVSISGMENRIVFTGEIQQSEIEEYYKKADLLLMTSFFETYSMVLQEAMVFKLPLISTDSGASMQTANSGIARFYKPGNISQLQKYLLSMLTNKKDYHELVNGYHNLNLKFESWNKKAGQFLYILGKYDNA